MNRINTGSPQAIGLVAYYPLNEQGGNIAFDGMGLKNGTLNNGAYFNNKCLQLDGTNDYVNLGVLDKTNGVSNLTVSCWAKMNTQDGRNTAFIYKGNAASIDRWAMGPSQTTIGDNNDILVILGNGSNSYCYTTSNCFPLNTLCHICFVFNGNNTGNSNRMKVYINGIEQTLTFGGTIPSSTYSGSNDAYIGFYNTLNYFPGQLRDMRIYTRSLTSTEVMDLYVNPNKLYKIY